MKNSILTFTLVLLATVIIIPLQSVQRANALSGSEFQAGNIIDDGIFFNRITMDANQVQAFLNSKVPTCDTTGSQIYSGSTTRAQYGASQGYPQPYTCLKDYKQDTPAMPAETALCNYLAGGVKTSAQIISDVSVACGINPQVLLVLLQKEQSLVTDDWPWPSQYNKATGFSCPDTSPCDPAYGNFFYQVYSAARQFKVYARDATQFNYRAGRNNTIYLHPGPCQTYTNGVCTKYYGNKYDANGKSLPDITYCGSTSVYIENQATANLYIYTPYQPNAAALNNLYGTGDTCSSYGNRNFWRMFSDWFGATHMSRVFKNPDSPTIYVQSAGYKFIVPTFAVLEDYGISPGSVQTLPHSYTDGITTPPAGVGLSSQIDNLVKTNSSQAVYVISRGARYTITSMDQFYAYGFREQDIVYLPDSLVFSVPTGGELNGFISTTSSNVFKVEAATKRIIFDYPTFISQNPSGITSKFSDNLAAKMPSGDPIASRDILVSNSNGWVRLFVGGVYYSIPTQDAYNCWGFGKTQSTPLYRLANDSYVSQYNPSKSISCNPVKDPATNTVYILSGNQRIELPSDFASIATQVDAPILNLAANLPFRSYPISPIYKDSAFPVIWYLESGTRRPIPSMRDLTLLGYSTVNVDVLNYSQLSSVPAGPLKLGTGSAVKTPDSGAVYITTSTSRIPFGTSDDFLAYGFSWSDIETIDRTYLDSYYPTTTYNLSHIAYNSSNDKVYMMDSIYCFELPDGLLPSYGLDKNTVKANQKIPASQIIGVDFNHCAAGSNLIKSPVSATIYKLVNGRKYAFGSWQELVSYAGTQNPYITTISQVNVNRY